MKSYQVTHYEGEKVGPIDWNFPFADSGWDKGGFMNPTCISPAVEKLHQLENGEWEVTSDGGWPRVGWKKVIDTGMYDGWPYWKPVPAILVSGPLGASWMHWWEITDIRSLTPTTSEEAGDGWISVDERLPDDCRSVGMLINGDFSDPVTGYFSPKEKTWNWQATQIIKTKLADKSGVTHWCELSFPEPPRAGRSAGEKR